MKLNISKVPINKFLGIYKDGKDTNSSFSHYAISKAQFEELELYINSLESNAVILNNSIISLKNENIINIENLKKEYNYKIKELQNIHNKEVEDLKHTIEDYKQELQRLKGLNGNLLRISRDRANQERNLRPKKVHKGFVILNRQSLYYKLYSNIKQPSRSNQLNYIEFPCFKIKIQTPFEASISFDLIEDEIIEAFSDFMKNLKIDNWYNYDYIVNQPISKIKDIIFNNQYDNFIFKYFYTANFKSNFWDIDVFTKKDIVN